MSLSLETSVVGAIAFCIEKLCIGAALFVIGGCTHEAGPKLEPLPTEPELEFSIDEGRIGNTFYRNGPVAAHVVTTSGRVPRLVVAFPAGNSGVSLWFDENEQEIRWGDIETVRGVRAPAKNGDMLYGVALETTLVGPKLRIEREVLGNMRSIRNYFHTGGTPAAIDTSLSIHGSRLVWQRPRMDGRGGYFLSVEALEGEMRHSDSGDIDLVPSAGNRLRLKIAALTGDTPLTPIPVDRIVSDVSADDALSLKVLAFLSYEEKLLAGSWRFLTYFGRDTLLTLKMLLPAATPELVEAGLGAVIDRVSPDGEVAHEEDIAEFALLRRAQKREEFTDEPIYDYKMIDDNLMLAPIAAEYLIDHEKGRMRAASFLSRETPKGELYGHVLVRNLNFVVGATRNFANDPGIGTLIRLKDGQQVGNWRDSREGLGGGVIPYDVNAVLAPAALRASARLAESGILDAFLDPDSSTLTAAAAMASVWEKKAPPLFQVGFGNEEARARISAYASHVGVPAEPALNALGEGDVQFSAVSLNADGTPVPVLHSDEVFALAFSEPGATALRNTVDSVTMPFPAGLMMPAGLLVANGAYGDRATVWPLFSQNRYHGAVVWSWQQALFAHGIQRQLARSDIDEGLRARLLGIQSILWPVIENGNSTKTSELWSWSFENDEYQIEPFGQRAADTTESNAAQLWSTVFLAVRPPGEGD